MAMRADQVKDQETRETRELRQPRETLSRLLFHLSGAYHYSSFVCAYFEHLQLLFTLLSSLAYFVASPFIGNSIIMSFIAAPWRFLASHLIKVSQEKRVRIIGTRNRSLPAPC